MQSMFESLQSIPLKHGLLLYDRRGKIPCLNPSVPANRPFDGRQQVAMRRESSHVTLYERVSYLSILGLAVLVGSATALRAQANPPRGPTVVELYTSQGCSSCPPADRVLGELSAMPNVIALAFHVDYWDSIGWRDHFSIPNAVERQHRYVESLGLSSAFTPQAVVDGRTSFVGSDKRRILDALAEPIDPPEPGGEWAARPTTGLRRPNSC